MAYGMKKGYRCPLSSRPLGGEPTGSVRHALRHFWGWSGGYQLRLRQLAAEFNMRLEERVAERTRIARDLHDTLLQSFQALLMRFQAGINMLAQRPADARRVLEDAVDRASQAIADGRDAIGNLCACPLSRRTISRSP